MNLEQLSYVVGGIGTIFVTAEILGEERVRTIDQIARGVLQAIGNVKQFVRSGVELGSLIGAVVVALPALLLWMAATIVLIFHEIYVFRAATYARDLRQIPEAVVALAYERASVEQALNWDSWFRHHFPGVLAPIDWYQATKVMMPTAELLALSAGSAVLILIVSLMVFSIKRFGLENRTQNGASYLLAAIVLMCFYQELAFGIIYLYAVAGIAFAFWYFLLYLTCALLLGLAHILLVPLRISFWFKDRYGIVSAARFMGFLLVLAGFVIAYVHAEHSDTIKPPEQVGREAP